jgi:release factor H-coupled RctB family protein
MPDLHAGKTYPIGATFVSTNIIYPALIGGDIGCGMALWKLKLSAEQIHPDRLASSIPAMENPWTDGDPAAWLRQAHVEPTPFDGSLGTIGGGNHFAEIQVIEEVTDKQRFTELGLSSSNAYLLVHSGSRGFGQSILDQHIESFQTHGLNTDSDAFKAYMSQHDRACAWAKRNRELIAHRILTSVGVEAEQQVLDIWHNNVTSREEQGRSVWVHRKGAAPSDKGLVVIPGSRGTFSYLVEPYGDQTENCWSLAHGAGRKWTRSKANATLRQKYQDANAKQALKTTAFGGVVVCDDRNLLFEEAPEAYKNVEEVVKDLERFARVIAVFKPLVTYKMRL